MKALLFPVGSSGDVHPFLGLGLELKKRGHSVTVITNGEFRSVTERSGLSFLELGEAKLYHQAADNPDLWNPRKSFYVIAKMVGQIVKPTVEIIKRLHVPGKTVIVGGSLAFGVRIAEEKWGIPAVIIHLQPGVLRSVYDPPVLPGLRIPRWFPAPVIRMLYGLVDFIVDRGLESVNATRAELGLIRAKSLMGSWWNSPRLTIGLFPEWYAPPQKDWPKSFQSTGFPLFDAVEAEESDPDVEQFLDAGSPPVVFTAGSAMKSDRRFFEESDRAVRLLGCRAAYLTRYPDQLPSSISVTAHHFSYVPFSKIFPRASIVVHHGGIGTVAQAFQAGRPQLVVPLTHDQPDNAARVVKLGAGKALAGGSYTGTRAARILKRMLADLKMADRVKKISERIDPLSLQKTAALIESIL